jgi:hypothetical protein
MAAAMKAGPIVREKRIQTGNAQLAPWEGVGDHPLTDMKDAPEGKPLRSVSFAVHATRGVIRDQNTRRKAMFALLLVAMLLLFAGLTFLAPVLNPRAHLLWSLIYWFACLWLTLTALLLALFDMLIVRADARKAERMLREQYPKAASAGSDPQRSE